MARIFPQRIPASLNDPKRSSELRVYTVMRDGLPEDYTVFYSVRWIMKDARGVPTTGEADFIVAHPRHGMIVLEVKGGRIEKEGRSGQWFSIDRDGERHPIKNPYEQAETNKFALIKRIQEHPSWKRKWIDASHAVIFPSLLKEPTDLGLDAWAEITLTAHDFPNIKNRIDGIFAFWQKKRDFGIEGVSVLTKILAPSFELRNPLRARIAETEQQILKLTEGQFEVLDMIAGTPRALISGGAGTGKTILAMEQARRLSNDGLSVLFTCFSRTLARFLNGSSDPSLNLKIQCFTDLVHGFVKETGQPVDLPSVDPMDLTLSEKKAFADALLQALDFNETRYDAIIVDEGQDFIQDWWTAVEFLLSERTDGVFYVFYDNNQLIHQDASALPKIPARLQLPEVVRNTNQIGRLARAFYGGRTLKDSGVDGEGIRFTQTDGGEIHARLDRVVSELTSRENFPLSDIAVLVPRATRESVYHAPKIGNRRVIHANEVETPGLLIETIGAFKGLDKPVIVLCEIDSIVNAGNLSIEQLYVGISRAKSLLIILAGERAIQILKSKSAAS